MGSWPWWVWVLLGCGYAQGVLAWAIHALVECARVERNWRNTRRFLLVGLLVGLFWPVVLPAAALVAILDTLT